MVACRGVLQAASNPARHQEFAVLKARRLRVTLNQVHRDFTSMEVSVAVQLAVAFERVAVADKSSAPSWKTGNIRWFLAKPL